jgi:cell division protein ZapB
MELSELQALETKIDVLIHTCEQLVVENRALRESQSSLLSERDSLLEKTALARTRIEAMIARLKAMETNVSVNL